MQKVTRVLLTIVISTCLINLSGCSDDDAVTEVQAQAMETATVYTPADNRKEIEVLEAQVAALLSKDNELHLAAGVRIKALESNVSTIEQTVTKNTGLYESLKLQLTGVTNTVSDFFKPKKVVTAKKSYKRKKKVAVVKKPKYKVIGIDQWGAYKYVQLMDTQGNLRLLRKSESVDGWKVNQISKKKVVLVNSKGVLMILIPQA